jgi:hypothetical protein
VGVEVSVGAIVATADPSNEDADAHDEAVLDLIALEMSAPDPADADGDIFGDEPRADEPRAEEPVPMAPTTIAAPPVATIEPPAAPLPPPQPSLGSTLIASGIVRRPVSMASDPLAPIRRLSQAEKIALFS